MDFQLASIKGNMKADLTVHGNPNTIIELNIPIKKLLLA